MSFIGHWKKRRKRQRERTRTRGRQKVKRVRDFSRSRLVNLVLRGAGSRPGNYSLALHLFSYLYLFLQKKNGMPMKYSDREHNLTRSDFITKPFA